MYGELLSALDLAPDGLVLALGDGTRTRFPLRSVASYVRAIRQRFLAALEP